MLTNHSGRALRLAIAAVRRRPERSLQWRMVAIGSQFVALAGCTGAPSRNVLGSYFPNWMFCILAGLLAAILVRQGLIVAGVDKTLPAPLLVYVALAAAFAFATWLLWLE